MVKKDPFFGFHFRTDQTLLRMIIILNTGPVIVRNGLSVRAVVWKAALILPLVTLTKVRIRRLKRPQKLSKNLLHAHINNTLHDYVE